PVEREGLLEEQPLAERDLLARERVALRDPGRLDGRGDREDDGRPLVAGPRRVGREQPRRQGRDDGSVIERSPAHARTVSSFFCSPRISWRKTWRSASTRPPSLPAFMNCAASWGDSVQWRVEKPSSSCFW